jgi:hypothetical protein
MKIISIKAINSNATQFNKYALKSTEKVVLKTIDKTEELQEFSFKAIKNTLNYTEKRQEIIFDKLETGKATFWKNLNKTLDFFSKN